MSNKSTNYAKTYKNALKAKKSINKAIGDARLGLAKIKHKYTQPKALADMKKQAARDYSEYKKEQTGDNAVRPFSYHHDLSKRPVAGMVDMAIKSFTPAVVPSVLMTSIRNLSTGRRNKNGVLMSRSEVAKNKADRSRHLVELGEQARKANNAAEIKKIKNENKTRDYLKEFSKSKKLANFAKTYKEVQAKKKK